MSRTQSSTRPTTLQDSVARHAAERPHHPALVCGSVQVTYQELDRRSDRTAQALAAFGVRRGSRIAHFAPDSERFHEIVLACAKTGAVLVPIDWRLTAAEVTHILRDSGTELLFFGPALAPLVQEALPALPRLQHTVPLDTAGFEAWADDRPADTGFAIPADADTEVVQIYTSGTTGAPKGVVLAQRSFFAVAGMLAEHGLEWIDWRADDRSLVCVPGFHIGGLWWATQGLNAGITNVLLPAFDSLRAVDLIREAGITTACMVPAMMRMMLDEPHVGRPDFATLRKVVYGGSPISDTLLRRGLDIFDCDLAQIYGLTETGNTAVCLPPSEHRPGSPRLAAAGLPYPGVRMRIVDSQGDDVPTGEIGQVWLHTPARMAGYWNLPDATARTLVDGWIVTGDAGYRDEDGYLYIRDRISDTIIVGGENVYPAEVENALCRHSAIAEAAVVGAPSSAAGEEVRAYIVLRQGHDVQAQELTRFLSGQLARFKIPGKYHVIDVVPRNPSGKILRRKLREQLWADSDRKVN
ncbi:long-chain-fatty-acid--CoA ligase [Streptomyces sp. ME19-01-6]|uniref:long-chain-fatty-acid--CoA ligase n=1 Tax=Streptomyces sp. ME19-01-6 TaxID=3028686 RepID=UPI0029BD56CA|nr:long-chain-fatty-acid--CoA ligase [Streptomyces sp. ME19-01-6]MDX3229166.1 long-chain-fatty-acid--CoA ligase [Streptomyces sp. ME19-01-6]